MIETRNLPALLVSEPEAAQMLAMSPRKLWGLAKAGRVRRLKVDGQVRYAVTDLEAFVRSIQDEQPIDADEADEVVSQ